MIRAPDARLRQQCYCRIGLLASSAEGSNPSIVDVVGSPARVAYGSWWSLEVNGAPRFGLVRWAVSGTW